MSNVQFRFNCTSQSFLSVTPLSIFTCALIRKTWIQADINKPELFQVSHSTLSFSVFWRTILFGSTNLKSTRCVDVRHVEVSTYLPPQGRWAMGLNKSVGAQKPQKHTISRRRKFCFLISYGFVRFCFVSYLLEFHIVYIVVFVPFLVW